MGIFSRLLGLRPTSGHTRNPEFVTIEAEYRMMRFAMEKETPQELVKFYTDVAQELRRQRDEQDVRYANYRVKGDLGG